MRRRPAWLACACAMAFCCVGAGNALADKPSEGDVMRGAEVYTRCLACHALEYDRTGPRHCGLLGRKAGSVPGFEYSTAMRNSNIVWTEETLNWFLSSPLTAMPGTSMGYAGLPDPSEREDLIAYLKKEGAGPRCAATP